MTYEPEFVAAMNHEILKVNPEAGQNEIDTAFIREFALLNEHGNEDTPERLMQLLELMHAWLAATPKERRDNRMLAAQGQLAVSQGAAREPSHRVTCSPRSTPVKKRVLPNSKGARRTTCGKVCLLRLRSLGF